MTLIDALGGRFLLEVQSYSDGQIFFVVLLNNVAAFCEIHVVHAELALPVLGDLRVWDLQFP